MQLSKEELLDSLAKNTVTITFCDPDNKLHMKDIIIDATLSENIIPEEEKKKQYVNYTHLLRANSLKGDNSVGFWDITYEIFRVILITHIKSCVVK